MANLHCVNFLMTDAVQEALGLKGLPVTHISIEFPVNKVPVLKVEMHAENDLIRRLCAALPQAIVEADAREDRRRKESVESLQRFFETRDKPEVEVDGTVEAACAAIDAIRMTGATVTGDVPCG